MFLALKNQTTPSSKFLSSPINQLIQKKVPTNCLYRHKNAVLDLSLPVRLTSLIQNSKIELVVASARARAQESKVTDVTIKLQVQDLPPSFSSNLLHTFSSNSSLWSVLAHFEKTSGINFTNRAVMHQVTPSSGHLVFETPIVQTFNKRVCRVLFFQSCSNF